MLELPDTLLLVGVRAAPSAMAALQLPHPAVRSRLVQQCTCMLSCVNAVEPVTLAGKPAAPRTFHDEVRRAHPGAR